MDLAALVAAHSVVAEQEALGDDVVDEATTSHIDGYGAVRSDGCGKLRSRQFFAPTSRRSVRGGYGGRDACRHCKTAAQILKNWNLNHQKSVLILIAKAKTDEWPTVVMAVSDQLHDQFPRVFCKHLSIDSLEKPVCDNGESYYHGICNMLPYIQGVIAGTYTDADYRTARAGKGWQAYLVAGTLLILIAAFYPKSQKQ